MFKEISYYLIFGKPLILYLGIITLVLLLSTAIVGYLFYKRKINLPFKLHIVLAVCTIVVALVHGFLGISAYF